MIFVGAQRINSHAPLANKNIYNFFCGGGGGVTCGHREFVGGMSPQAPVATPLSLALMCGNTYVKIMLMIVYIHVFKTITFKNTPLCTFQVILSTFHKNFF